MDSCYHESMTNCVKNPHDKPSGYECCSEKTGKPTLGLWVKEGTCDSVRGICKSKVADIMNIIKENFTISTIEGFDGSSSQKRTMLWVGTGLLFFVILFVIYRKVQK